LTSVIEVFIKEKLIYMSFGSKPVCLAIRASIRGQISSYCKFFRDDLNPTSFQRKQKSR